MNRYQFIWLLMLPLLATVNYAKDRGESGNVNSKDIVIVSPKNDAIAAPGTRVKVVVKVKRPLLNVQIVEKDAFNRQTKDSPPFEFDVQMPADSDEPLTLTAVGMVMPGELLFSEPVHVHSSLQSKNKKPTAVLIEKSLEFSIGDRADFLSALKKKNSELLKVIPREASNPDASDFILVSIKEEESKPFTRYIARLRFEGKGGIQDAFAGQRAPFPNDSRLSELTQAPSSGYAQELDLSIGRVYVARLRDGNHYMKLTTYGGNSYNGLVRILITFFIQPEASANLTGPQKQSR